MLKFVSNTLMANTFNGLLFLSFIKWMHLSLSLSSVHLSLCSLPKAVLFDGLSRSKCVCLLIWEFVCVCVLVSLCGFPLGVWWSHTQLMFSPLCSPLTAEIRAHRVALNTHTTAVCRTQTHTHIYCREWELKNWGSHTTTNGLLYVFSATSPLKDIPHYATHTNVTQSHTTTLYTLTQ